MVTAIAKKIIIQKLPDDEPKKGKLLMVDNTHPSYCKAIVVSVGDEVTQEIGSGDVVLVMRSSTLATFKVQDSEFICITQDSIIALLDEYEYEIKVLNDNSI